MKKNDTIHRKTTALQKRNRRFKRNIAVDKRNEKRKRYKARKKDIIKEIMQMLQIKMRLTCLMLYYLKTKKLYRKKEHHLYVDLLT